MKFFRFHVLGILLLVQATMVKGEVESLYTPILTDMVKSWPPPEGIDFSKVPSDELDLRCLETPERPYFVGVRMLMHINTPFQRAQEVISNYAEYEKYFPTYKEIKVTEKGEKVFQTFWEQIVDVFFVPNVKFTLKHEVVEANEKRVVTRYQMMSANLLESCDGLIVMESAGKKTRYSEFSFSETSPGVLRSLGSRPVWEDSLRSYYLSTMGIKLKAENVDWSYDQIIDESKKRFNKLDLDAIVVKKGRLIQFR